MIYLDKDEQKLLENLKKQYDENLTEEQKHALIRYNSSLFLFYNKIMSIEDYANKSIEELYTIMKPFIEQNEFYLKNVMMHIQYVIKFYQLMKIILKHIFINLKFYFMKKNMWRQSNYVMTI